MSKLKGEILFNRAPLWLVLSYAASLRGNETLALINLIPVAYNAWKSLRAWGEDE